MSDEQDLRTVDAHQHLWVLSERAYDWIGPDYGPLNADFDWSDAVAARKDTGIARTVLVQAADTYEDSMFMLGLAGREPAVCGVVAWIPLDRPVEAETALELYRASGMVKGIRALTHGYADPNWILRPDVARTLALLPSRGLTLDYVATSSEHLEALIALANANPRLIIVLDHLGTPPIAAGGWQPWAGHIETLAAASNVVVKLSGLATCSDLDNWTSAQWQPYVDHVVGLFGSTRVMMGSDWPVSILAGTFSEVWAAQREVIATLSRDQQDDVLFRTAERVYSLSPAAHPTTASSLESHHSETS